MLALSVTSKAPPCASIDYNISIELYFIWKSFVYMFTAYFLVFTTKKYNQTNVQGKQSRMSYFTVWNYSKILYIVRSFEQHSFT